ncbi:MAG: GntR family transcriptional regulator [Chloroflexi bacterium]|nr:GntR family transcriptional regulator [Chloroflexota bacterium]
MATSPNTPNQLRRIDKSSPLPYHFQLREIIRGEIAANRWQHGDQLPSENQLCELFAVSRTTVREALDALVNEGLLRREKGLGTFVADPKFLEIWSGSAIGFSDSITQQGYLIDTRVLELTTVPASLHVARELNLPMSTEVYLLRRLRYIMKLPILVVHSYIPTKLFPGLHEIDFTTASLYQTFRNVYGSPVRRVKRGIEALGADENVAGLLELEPGSPVMFIENTAFTDGGTRIEYYTAWRRGDKSRFQFEYSMPQPTTEPKD